MSKVDQGMKEQAGWTTHVHVKRVNGMCIWKQVSDTCTYTRVDDASTCRRVEMARAYVSGARRLRDGRDQDTTECMLPINEHRSDGK